MAAGGIPRDPDSHASFDQLHGKIRALAAGNSHIHCISKAPGVIGPFTLGTRVDREMGTKTCRTETCYISGKEFVHHRT